MELGVDEPAAPIADENGEPISGQRAQEAALHRTGRTLAGMAIVDIAVFFAVLMVGFAYVWKRGDLDWVRAVARQRAAGQVERMSTAEPVEEEPVLTA